MCGIAGIVDLEGTPVRHEDVRAMCDAIVHRGPDDEGFYTDSRAALGMRRLSIIDLEAGHQPIRNEDGSIRVVFNGEIYNYRELRRELIRQGHVFYTSSDTETIVHLYEEHGDRCVEKLRGMFAFAVWDRARSRLLLARDRFGIKPLYYGMFGSRLVFASELKSILTIPDLPARIHSGALSHLFTFLTTPTSQSIIDGVRKLEPAHILVLEPGREPRTERYWNVTFEPDSGHDEEHYVERLRELLEESVFLHMVSDVPVGAFLSGGIDSSAVVASMARLTSSPIKTFSIGFAEKDFDELKYARMVARKYGTDHHELVVEPDVLSVLDDIAWHLDEPFGDPSAIPTYMVSKLAAASVKVALSGDGGDEIFAGYDKYLVERRDREGLALPPSARRALGLVGRALPDGMRGRHFLNHKALSGPKRYIDSMTLFRHDEIRRLFTPEAYEQMSGRDPSEPEVAHFARFGGDWLSTLQQFDLQRYLPLDILTKVDRMSMAHSLEVRVPLLDHVLVEFAATIPPGLKLKGNTTKYIFKRAMKGILPDTILDRPKQGFAVPLGRWFRGRLTDVVEETLLSDTGRRRGIFNAAYVRKLIDRHKRGRELDLHLWTMISFELWCRRFLDSAPGSAVSTGQPELSLRPGRSILPARCPS